MTAIPNVASLESVEQFFAAMIAPLVNTTAVGLTDAAAIAGLVADCPSLQWSPQVSYRRPLAVKTTAATNPRSRVSLALYNQTLWQPYGVSTDLPLGTNIVSSESTEDAVLQQAGHPLARRPVMESVASLFSTNRFGAQCLAPGLSSGAGGETLATNETLMWQACLEALASPAVLRELNTTDIPTALVHSVASNRTDTWSWLAETLPCRPLALTGTSGSLGLLRSVAGQAPYSVVGTAWQPSPVTSGSCDSSVDQTITVDGLSSPFWAYWTSPLPTTASNTPAGSTPSYADSTSSSGSSSNSDSAAAPRERYSYFPSPLPMPQSWYGTSMQLRARGMGDGGDFMTTVFWRADRQSRSDPSDVASETVPTVPATLVFSTVNRSATTSLATHDWPMKFGSKLSHWVFSDPSARGSVSLLPHTLQWATWAEGWRAFLVANAHTVAAVAAEAEISTQRAEELIVHFAIFVATSENSTTYIGSAVAGRSPALTAWGNVTLNFVTYPLLGPRDSLDSTFLADVFLLLRNEIMPSAEGAIVNDVVGAVLDHALAVARDSADLLIAMAPISTAALWPLYEMAWIPKADAAPQSLADVALLERVVDTVTSLFLSMSEAGEAAAASHVTPLAPSISPAKKLSIPSSAAGLSETARAGMRAAEATGAYPPTYMTSASQNLLRCRSVFLCGVDLSVTFRGAYNKPAGLQTPSSFTASLRVEIGSRVANEEEAVATASSSFSSLKEHAMRHAPRPQRRAMNPEATPAPPPQPDILPTAGKLPHIAGDDNGELYTQGVHAKLSTSTECVAVPPGALHAIRYWTGRGLTVHCPQDSPLFFGDPGPFYPAAQLGGMRAFTNTTWIGANASQADALFRCRLELVHSSLWTAQEVVEMRQWATTSDDSPWTPDQIRQSKARNDKLLVLLAEYAGVHRSVKQSIDQSTRLNQSRPSVSDYLGTATPLPTLTLDIATEGTVPTVHDAVTKELRKWLTENDATGGVTDAVWDRIVADAVAAGVGMRSSSGLSPIEFISGPAALGVQVDLNALLEWDRATAHYFPRSVNPSAPPEGTPATVSIPLCLQTLEAARAEAVFAKTVSREPGSSVDGDLPSTSATSYSSKTPDTSVLDTPTHGATILLGRRVLPQVVSDMMLPLRGGRVVTRPAPPTAVQNLTSQGMASQSAGITSAGSVRANVVLLELLNKRHAAQRQKALFSGCMYGPVMCGRATSAMLMPRVPYHALFPNTQNVDLFSAARKAPTVSTMTERDVGGPLPFTYYVAPPPMLDQASFAQLWGNATSWGEHLRRIQEAATAVGDLSEGFWSVRVRESEDAIDWDYDPRHNRCVDIFCEQLLFRRLDPDTQRCDFDPAFVAVLVIATVAALILEGVYCVLYFRTEVHLRALLL